MEHLITLLLQKIKYNDPEAAHREDESNYRLLAEWGSNDCSKLPPCFSKHCKSLVFLSMHEGTIFGGNWNTYAYISQEEGDYVVPITPVTRVRLPLGSLFFNNLTNRIFGLHTICITPIEF